MIKFYVTGTRYHRVGHIFITFIYSLSAVREFLLKYLIPDNNAYLIAFTFSGLSENASHICRNPASVSYTSVGQTQATKCEALLNSSNHNALFSDLLEILFATFVTK